MKYAPGVLVLAHRNGINPGSSTLDKLRNTHSKENHQGEQEEAIDIDMDLDMDMGYDPGPSVDEELENQVEEDRAMEPQVRMLSSPPQPIPALPNEIFVDVLLPPLD